MAVVSINLSMLQKLDFIFSGFFLLFSLKIPSDLSYSSQWNKWFSSWSIPLDYGSVEGQVSEWLLCTLILFWRQGIFVFQKGQTYLTCQPVGREAAVEWKISYSFFCHLTWSGSSWFSFSFAYRFPLHCRLAQYDPYPLLWLLTVTQRAL